MIETQIRAALFALHAEGRARLVYAYEPVWAIGTGRTASPADAAEAHGIVRARLSGFEGCDPPRSVILYGGSVKPANIGQLLAAPGVDGVLVGGASLDPDSWAAICGAGA